MSVTAQRLVDRHGLDGFTMDELAAAVGVSRRTLFNYFDSKVDAVLGRKPDISGEQLASFCDGGPTGDLVSDMAAMAEDLISAQLLTRDEVELSRRVLAEPRLLLASHARFAEWRDEFIGLIAEREGEEFDARRARIVVSVFIALLDISLDSFVAEGGARGFEEIYAETLATTRAVMAPVPRAAPHTDRPGPRPHEPGTPATSPYPAASPHYRRP